MKKNDLGLVPEQRRWSLSAIDCYKRGCICKDCPTAGYISERCQMKATVLELVRLLGIPQMDYCKNNNNMIN